MKEELEDSLCPFISTIAFRNESAIIFFLYKSRLRDSRLISSDSAICASDLRKRFFVPLLRRDFAAAYFTVIIIADLFGERCFSLIYGQPVRRVHRCRPFYLAFSWKPHSASRFCFPASINILVLRGWLGKCGALSVGSASRCLVTVNETDETNLFATVTFVGIAFRTKRKGTISPAHGRTLLIERQ